MNRPFLCLAAVAVAVGLTAACDGAQPLPSVSPTAPSGTITPGFSTANAHEVSPAQVEGACGIPLPGQPGSPDAIWTRPATPPEPGFGEGIVIIGPGAPEKGATPVDGVTQGEVFLVGQVGSVAGSYPSLVLVIGETTVLTDAATTFHNVSTSSITQGSRLGASGTSQSDRTLSARCIVGL